MKGGLLFRRVLFVFIILFSTLLSYAQCPDPPIPVPTCPCSGNPVTDNTTVGAGVWCYNGGEADGIINGLYLNQSSSVVIICADVTLTNTYINSGYIVIAPGVTVNYDNGWTSSWIDGGIINYGTLFLGSDFSLSPNGQLFNYGYLEGKGITVTGSSKIVIGVDTATTILDQIDIQSSCGLCFNNGPSAITTDTFYASGNLQPGAICNENGGPVCVSVLEPAVVINSTITQDTSTTYFCVPDQATENYVNSTPYVGSATVDICQCNQVLSVKELVLFLEPIDQSSIKLHWQLRSPIKAKLYKLFRSSKDESFIPTADLTDSVYIDTVLHGPHLYFVKAFLGDGTTVTSNIVSFYPEFTKPFLLAYLHDNLFLVCNSPICKFSIISEDGKLISEKSIKQGTYRINNVLGNLPQALYIIKPTAGLIKIIVAE